MDLVNAIAAVRLLADERKDFIILAIGGVAQRLEQGLHKAKVAGSSPAAATLI